MNAATAVLVGVLAVAGLLLLVGGLRRREATPTPRRRSAAQAWARWTRRPSGVRGRHRDLLLLGSTLGGLALAALTGWLVCIVVMPGLMLGLPYLLRMPRPRDVELLEALDRWVRALAATLATGKSIPDAIRVSRRTAPAAIADEVNTLVLRLNNRWETGLALHRFADALDSPDADGVVAALILAAGRGADGASVTLHALADSIQSQLKARRAIEVERSKPYVVVRQVTVISLVTLTGMFLLRPQFFAAYRTPVGQAVLIVLVTLYFGSLLLMRRKAHQPERPRILVGPLP